MCAAAVAVTGAAFAQANITGVLDVTAISNGTTTTQASSAVASQTTKTNATSGMPGGWATSELRFSGSEDLGGGLTASFQLNSDLRGATPGFVTRDRFLGLSGGFGSVRLGAFVPAAAAGFHGFSGARTTGAPGNIYGIATGAPASNAILHGSAANFERQNNIQYTSPNMNGLTVNLAYGTTSSDRSDANRAGKNQGSQTSLHLGYASGPLSVGVGMNNRTDKIEAAPAGTPSTTQEVGGVVTAVNFGTPGATTSDVGVRTAAVTRAETKSTLNWVGASYDLGVARVMATHVKRTDKNSLAANAKTTDVTANAIGVTVPMGAITLGASTFRGTDKRGAGAQDDYKLSGHQLSLTYAMSKRTTLYVANGTTQNKRNTAANTGATVKTTATNIGLAHSF